MRRIRVISKSKRFWRRGRLYHCLSNVFGQFRDFQLIERAQEENRRLLSLLEDRDHKIIALEARLLKQQHEMAVERERLREENATLIRAMAALASN